MPRTGPPIRSWKSELSCPRCKVGMFGAALESFLVTACGGCGGVWLDKKTRRRMARKRHSGAVRLAELAARKSTRGADTKSKIGCLQCDARMRRKRIKGTNVIVDVCAQHGTWFDKEEMPKVAAALLERHLEREEAKLLAAARDERLTPGERRAVELMHSPEPDADGPNISFSGGGVIGLAIALIFDLTLGNYLRKRWRDRRNEWLHFAGREDEIE